MPVFNADAFLTEAIESILSQTFRDFEFIIICDEPTDKTHEIIERYQKIDDRIKVIFQKRKGLVSSLNQALKLAKGEYIARMDADDISHPQRFEKQIEFLEKNSDIDLCGAWANFIGNNREISSVFKPANSPNLIKWDLHFFNAIAHPTVVMRKTFFEKNGQYLDSDIHCEDYALWVRAMNTSKMCNLPLILVDLRHHELNVTKCHTEIQRDQSVRVSQSAISSTLGYTIPIENVRIINRQSNNSTYDEVIATMKNLDDLQDMFLQDTTITHDERKYIRKSLCIFFFGIGVDQIPNEPIRVPYIFTLSFMKDPFCFIRSCFTVLYNRIPLRMMDRTS